MFDLRKPCNNCPFRKGAGRSFRLTEARLHEIVNASAFECHKTTGVAGKKHPPQQCAGLMSVLHKSGRPNQIMQVAHRLIGHDASQIDGSETYDSWEQCVDDHITD